jgi:hypothetical protein
MKDDLMQPSDYVTRTEAIRLSLAILLKAEEERLAIVEAEASKGIQYVD